MQVNGPQNELTATADPQRSLRDWQDTIKNNELKAGDRLHPVGTEAERTLLILAAACGLVPLVDVKVHNYLDRADKIPVPAGISGSNQLYSRIYKDDTGGVIRQHDAFTNGYEYEDSKANRHPYDYGYVWMDPAWSWTVDNKTRVLWGGHSLGADVCAAWMHPGNCRHLEKTAGCKEDWVYYGGTPRLTTGVGSEWLKRRGSITNGDIRRIVAARQSELNAHPPMEEVNPPSDVDVARVGEIVRTVQGLNVMKRVLFAVVTLLTALVFLYSLGGLTLGVLLAQIILALTLILMPVLLFVSAFPHDGARKLQKKLIRVWIAASLSYAIFFTTLAVLMLIITLVDDIATSVIPTSDGGLLDILITPFVALLSVKLLKSIAKTLGADITSFKGALQFTSGMTATGMSMSPIAFARETMSPLTSSFKHAAAPALRAERMGMKAARTVTDSYGRGLEQAKGDGYRGIGAFAHGLKESAIDGYKESIARPLNVSTMSNHEKWQDKLSLEALDYKELEKAGQEWEDKDTTRQQLAEKRTMINGAKRVMKEYRQGRLSPLPPPPPSAPPPSVSAPPEIKSAIQQRRRRNRQAR